MSYMEHFISYTVLYVLKMSFPHSLEIFRNFFSQTLKPHFFHFIKTFLCKRKGTELSQLLPLKFIISTKKKLRRKP